MKNSKPKGKTPSLIGSTLGAPNLCMVARESNCNRCKAIIAKNTECFEIPQLGGPFASKKRYCNACFGLIINKTKGDLDAIFTTYQEFA